MVVAAWGATGHPSANTTDPFDVGAVPSRLILRPARRSMLEQWRQGSWLSAHLDARQDVGSNTILLPTSHPNAHGDAQACNGHSGRRSGASVS